LDQGYQNQVLPITAELRGVKPGWGLVARMRQLTKFVESRLVRNKYIKSILFLNKNGQRVRGGSQAQGVSAVENIGDLPQIGPHEPGGRPTGCGFPCHGIEVVNLFEACRGGFGSGQGFLKKILNLKIERGSLLRVCGKPTIRGTRPCDWLMRVAGSFKTIGAMGVS